jgi:hypothetical protein
MFRTGAQFFILTLLVGLFLMRESSRDPLASIEEGFADFLSINARRSTQPTTVTFVRINESSLRGHPWPWTPVDFALFFQSAHGFRPEVLATDELLNWDRSRMKQDLLAKISQYEQILQEQIRQSPRVLLGAQLGYPEDPDRLPEIQPAPVLRHVKGNVAAVPEFTVIEAQASEDFTLSSKVGFTNLPGAGQQRMVPLVLRYRGQLVPTFVLHEAIIWEKLSLDDVQVELGSRIVLGDHVEIPIDEAGRMRVDFGAPKDRCGLDDLVLAAEQRDAGSETSTPADWFSGRLLLLSRDTDQMRTISLAAGRRVSRGELFASSIATIHGRSFIQRAPWWVDAIIIACYASLAVAARRWGKGITLFLGFVSLLAYTLVALAVFGVQLVWMPAVLPAGLVLFIVAYRLATPMLDPWAVPPKR